jgi:hypothetical protein
VFASALRNGFVACFSVSVVSVKAGFVEPFLGGDIGGSGQHPTSVQKNTFSDDRQHAPPIRCLVSMSETTTGARERSANLWHYGGIDLHRCGQTEKLA